MMFFGIEASDGTDVTMTILAFMATAACLIVLTGMRTIGKNQTAATIAPASHGSVQP